MSKDMKITMLGLSMAGKTCYMLAMYNKMSEGVNGFTLSTKDLDDDLELSGEWERLVYDGEWPKPTTEDYHTYHFNFNYGVTTQIMGFEWIDYRGGALTDSYVKEDVQKLLENLKESSCVFLCISGEYLQEPADASINKKAGVKRMNLLLTQYSSEGEKVPIVILITKFDLCKKRSKIDILEDIKKIFSVFFTEGTGWPVMVCPVTLGMDIVNNINDCLIAPIGVHLPLIFAIYSEIMKDAYESKENVEKSKKRLEELQNRHWLSKLLDKFQGINQENSAMVNLKNNQAKMDEIQQKMLWLTKELNNSNIDLYYDGRKGGANV